MPEACGFLSLSQSSEDLLNTAQNQCLLHPEDDTQMCGLRAEKSRSAREVLFCARVEAEHFGLIQGCELLY